MIKDIVIVLHKIFCYDSKKSRIGADKSDQT